MWMLQGLMRPASAVLPPSGQPDRNTLPRVVPGRDLRELPARDLREVSARDAREGPARDARELPARELRDSNYPRGERERHGASGSGEAHRNVRPRR